MKGPIEWYHSLLIITWPDTLMIIDHRSHNNKYCMIAFNSSSLTWSMINYCRCIRGLIHISSPVKQRGDALHGQDQWLRVLVQHSKLSLLAPERQLLARPRAVLVKRLPCHTCTVVLYKRNRLGIWPTDWISFILPCSSQKVMRAAFFLSNRVSCPCRSSHKNVGLLYR